MALNETNLHSISQTIAIIEKQLPTVDLPVHSNVCGVLRKCNQASTNLVQTRITLGLQSGLNKAKTVGITGSRILLVHKVVRVMLKLYR